MNEKFEKRLDLEKDNNEDNIKEKIGAAVLSAAGLESHDEDNMAKPELEESSNYTSEHIKELLKQGIGVDDIVDGLSSSDVDENFDILLQNGADINKIKDKLSSDDFYKRFEALIEHGVEIDDKLLRMTLPSELIKNIDFFLGPGGVTIDCFMNYISRSTIIEAIDTLVEHGAKVDINWVLDGITQSDAGKYIDSLFKYGADPNKIVEKLSNNKIHYNIERLLEYGADANKTLDAIGTDIFGRPTTDGYLWVADYIDTFLKHGADINKIVDNLWPSDVAENMEKLLRNGADVDKIMKKISPEEIYKKVDVTNTL